MSTVPTLRERVATAIVEAAAGVLAAGGQQAGMSEVAAAAGVARATVYRYFPSRQALLDELARLAVRDLADRLSDAHLDDVDVAEALERAVRALVTVGDYLVVLEQERVQPDPDTFEAAVTEPLRRLFSRGQDVGSIRSDIPPGSLTEALLGLTVAILRSGQGRGVEATTALVSSLFLRGAAT